MEDKQQERLLCSGIGACTVFLRAEGHCAIWERGVYEFSGRPCRLVSLASAGTSCSTRRLLSKMEPKSLWKVMFARAGMKSASWRSRSVL